MYVYYIDIYTRYCEVARKTTTMAQRQNAPALLMPASLALFVATVSPAYL